MVVDPYKARNTRRKFLDSTRKINCTKLAFPPQQKNLHNRTTVLYTKQVRTKNYFLPDLKKTNTTPQLYGTLST